MKPHLTVLTHVEIKRIDVNTCFTAIQIRNAARNAAHIACSNPLNSRPILLLFFLIFAAVSVRSQTTIVIVRDRDQVVVAADSKISNSEMAFCKIRKCGSSYLTVSGLYSPKIGRTKATAQSFDIWPMLLEHCSTTMTPTQQISRLENVGIAWLDSVFETGFETLNAQQYQQLKERGQIQIGILGWHGSPYFFTRIIQNSLSEPRAKAVVTGQYNAAGVLPKNEVEHRILGYYDNLPNESERGKAFRYLGLAKGAEFLVNHMIVSRPDDVGPPVDVLQVTRDGPKWIEPKPECEEKKETPKPKWKSTRRSGRK